MNPRHARLRELFVRACELDPEARAAFLDDACRDDPELRAEVETLLAHDSGAGVELDAEGLGARVLARELGGHAPAREVPPPTFGEYRILATLGSGGMGVVYEAEQRHPQRRVALKVVRSAFATAEARRRFRQEIDVLARMRHPGIAQVFAAGVADDGSDTPFLAMELVRGRPIARWADEVGASPRERLELVASLCEALHYAHGLGVVHRDLKPANVLVEDAQAGATPQPKILDFGVAKVLGEGGSLSIATRSGQVVGTLAYMSPEQARGDSGSVDARSDVYSVGVMLYELLCGRLPIVLDDAALHECARRICETEPVRIGKLDRALRGDVETIVHKALEKERERRYQSAQDLADDIRLHLADRPITARPSSALHHVIRFARRHRGIAAGIAIAFAALSAATGVSLWQLAVAEVARADSEKSRGVAEARAEELTRATWSGYRATLVAATTALDLGDGRSAERLLAAIPADAGQRFEARHVRARFDRSTAIVTCTAPVCAVSFAPDGALLVASADGRIRRCDVESGSELASVATGTRLWPFAAIARDGTRLAGLVDDGERVGVWDAVSGALVAARPLRSLMPPALAEMPRYSASRDDVVVAIAPDGRSVAVGGRWGSALWRPDDDGVAPLVHTHTTSVAYSADGRRVACGFTRPGGFARFACGDPSDDAIGGTRHDNGIARIDAIALSSGGERIVLGDGDGVVRVHELVERTRATPESALRSFLGHTGEVVAVAIAGELVVSAAADRTVRTWDIEEPGVRRTFVVPGDVTCLALDATATRIAVAHDESVRVFELAERDATSELLGHTSYVYGVAWTAAGATLVSGAWDGDLRFWDGRSGDALGALPSQRRRILSLAAPAHGDWIATGHERGEIRIWSARTAAPLRTLSTGAGTRPLALSCSDDGTWLAARTPTGVRLWEPSRGVERALLPCEHDSASCPVAVSPDGSLVATDDASAVVVWRTHTGERLWRLEHAAGRVLCLAFDARAERLAIGTDDATAVIWNLATGRPPLELRGHRRALYAVAFTPDGSRLATGSDDDTIALWDTETGDDVLRLSGHGAYVRALAFSPDGDRLASASGDGSVRLWDTRSIGERRRLRDALRDHRRAMAARVAALSSSNADRSAAAAALRDDASLAPLVRDAALQVLLRTGLEPR